MAPYEHVIWYYSSISDETERVRVHVTADPPRGWTFESEKQRFEKANHGLRLIAVEPLADYEAAKKADAQVDMFGPSAAWVTARGQKLSMRRRGILHPMFDTITAVDTVYWLEDDPHPVDGQPTLFTSEQDVRQYGVVGLALTIPEVEQRIRKRGLFAFN